VAVAAFLEGRIRWISIPDVLDAVLARHDGGHADSPAAVIDADRRAREVARAVIAERFSE
jgi:1-deoxy-D-xylulose-5-phosphate reductoisomerase